MNRRRPLTKSFALRRGAAPGGFSLVELLVASGIGLVVMAAVGQLFGIFGRGVSQGQARVEANSRLRNVTWRLRQDLVGRTAPPQRLVLVDSSSGYFQVMAGPSLTVDILALTTSVPGAAFGGRLDGAKGYESPVAEVAGVVFKNRVADLNTVNFDLSEVAMESSSAPAPTPTPAPAK